MTQILNRVRDVDPNNSEAVKDALATFFPNLSKHTELDPYRWLRALDSVINRFPKYCMSHRATIETYLTHFLDSSSYYNAIEAAKCAHALQQVRPSQEKTSTPKSSWRDQMNLLCDAAHMLIGAVFPQAVDIYKHNKKSKKDAESTSPLSSALLNITNVAKAPTSNVNKHTILATRLRNVFVFLQAMLVEIYPVAKPIHPQAILDVIVRALSVSSGTTKRLADVAMVKTQALRSLDALVACLGPNLIPFSPLVVRFVMQTLKWTSENLSDEARQVRCTAYNSLGRWLSSLRAQHTADRARCWEDELTEHVIDDVTPPRHLVRLTMSAQPTKRLSKKAKRKYANSMLQDSGIAAHMPGERNKIHVADDVSDEVAIAALECAEIFLTVCGIFLKPTMHKRFQERLVRECYNMSSYSGERALCLLRALEASRAGAPHALPPPTQHCLQLYSAALRSEHREISKFCSQALLNIRLQLHCAPPSINFAMELPPEEQKRTEDKKLISEKNKAALQALLGKDRMPRQNQEVDEDIITIADEPSNKRPRLEEDESPPDQISVSSESDASIEISDESDEGNSFVQEVEVFIEKMVGDKSNDITNEEIDAPEMQIDEIDGNDVGELEPDKEATENVANENKENDDKDVEKQIEENDVPSQIEKYNIHEANTQMPANISNETEEEIPLSMEVTYDYPNTGKEKVKVLEKIEDENLPSTNDTDDIQITCGQVIKYSQDADSDKKTEILEVKLPESVPKVNGVDKSPTKVVENGFSKNIDDKESAATSTEAISVNDMLKDFVDEVNDDNQVSTTA